MHRFTVKIRESKYSDRCPIHTTDIASSRGVQRTSKLKRELNQRSRASLRITERELEIAPYLTKEAIKISVWLEKAKENTASALLYLEECEAEYGVESYAARNAEQEYFQILDDERELEKDLFYETSMPYLLNGRVVVPRVY